MIRAVRLEGNNVICHGTTQDYTFDANAFKDHFVEFRGRPSEFYDHMDMSSKVCYLWKHNCYFLPTNWMFSTIDVKTDERMERQFNIANPLPSQFNFAELSKEVEINQYGHLVAPWGFSDLPEESELPHGTQYCSCGSFQSQWNHFDEFKKILGEDYVPVCKHIAYMKKISEYRSKRTALSVEQEKSREFKCAAFFYVRSHNEEGSEGNIYVLYIHDRSTMPINKWKSYMGGVPVPASRSWELIDKMMANGYVPYPGHKVPSLINFRPAQPVA
jgi:ssDNA-binding Zn-finger/Zn-ribbon topoisomerase 1